MNHLTEEQLVLHYYGEDPGELAGGAHEMLDALAIEQHLDDCAECRTMYSGLQRVLNIVDALPIPEQPADYEARVWQQISNKLPVRRRLFDWSFAPWRWAALGVATAGLLVTAFVAGRFYAPAPAPDGRPMPG
jgi:predicted anti-sigma-YlaC factor YlaD